jgi:hypothetical protein
MLLLVDALAREKSVEKGIVFEALEMALASATKRKNKLDIDYVFRLIVQQVNMKVFVAGRLLTMRSSNCPTSK